MIPNSCDKKRNILKLSERTTSSEPEKMKHYIPAKLKWCLSRDLRSLRLRHLQTPCAREEEKEDGGGVAGLSSALTHPPCSHMKLH